VLDVLAHVSGFRDLLTSVLAANLTQVSVRQNEDVRRISAWAAIIAVPTMIAGIYGMNFDSMPELRLAARLPGRARSHRRRVRLALGLLPAHRLALTCP
jgi:Mg2+ and Co2+ transporter CorA